MTPIDPQDPLPEPSWLWRRLYVYVVSIAFLVLISMAVHRMSEVASVNPETGVAALLTVIKWLIAALICVLTYYLVAPSAEQIVKMIQASRLKRTQAECEAHRPPTPSAAAPPASRPTRQLPTDPAPTNEPPEDAPWH